MTTIKFTLAEAAQAFEDILEYDKRGHWATVPAWAMQIAKELNTTQLGSSAIFLIAYKEISRAFVSAIEIQHCCKPH
jgi:hypothetical protein